MTRSREIERLPGRHLYFLDDHLFGNPRFAASLFDGMRGMGRLWQAAGTVQSILRQDCWNRRRHLACAASSLASRRSIPRTCGEQHKNQNLNRDYTAAIKRLHDLGVMVNASFVFGMDGDDESVFDRTVEWAISQGIETATFHILTPYPDTALHTRMQAQGRLLHSNWDLYDTRHVVYRPAKLTPEALESGYWRAYKDFYRWGSIVRGALTHEGWGERLRHAAYAGGWKKLEPMWDFIIRAKRASSMLPVLETVLAAFGSRRPTHQGATELEIPPTPLEPAPSVARAEMRPIALASAVSSPLHSNVSIAENPRLPQRLDVLPSTTSRLSQ